ncbi:MAG: AEC family transporter [Hespellia sp.]|nr:AEC family transporter [Hespellia sp.]
MQTVFTLIQQTGMMFFLAGIGFLLFKTKKISVEGSKSIGNILIFVVLPCVIVNGFLIERTKERIIALGLSALLAFTILMISVLISRLIFKKDAIAAFGAAFSNPGFFGVPLIVASLSDGAVFYIASFIAFLNLLQWTYGVAIMTGQRGRIQIKKLICAPFFLAIVVGFLLFITQCPLSGLLTKTLSALAGLNTPLAMFTVGVYLAQTDLIAMFKRKQLYLICLVRLLVIPLISLVVMIPISAKYADLKTAILIASACPVGSNIAVYAQLHEKNYTYAVEAVVVSTLFSIVTIPCIIFLADTSMQLLL